MATRAASTDSGVTESNAIGFIEEAPGSFKVNLANFKEQQLEILRNYFCDKSKAGKTLVFGLPSLTGMCLTAI
jgi:hypothetical protein